MKVKARLSNPLPKTQAVKGGMCGGFRIGHGSGGATSNFGDLFVLRIYFGNWVFELLFFKSLSQNFQLLAGRGFGRVGRPFYHANFQRNRGFYQGGRGQTGRMGFPNEFEFDDPYTEFHGRQFTGRG